MAIQSVYLLIGYIYAIYLLFNEQFDLEMHETFRSIGFKAVSRKAFAFIKFFVVFMSELLWPVDMIYDIYVFISRLIRKKK